MSYSCSLWYLSIRTCRAQAAHETVVDAAEQLLFFVRDEDNCKLRQAVGS